MSILFLLGLVGLYGAWCGVRRKVLLTWFEEDVDVFAETERLLLRLIILFWSLGEALRTDEYGNYKVLLGILM